MGNLIEPPIRRMPEGYDMPVLDETLETIDKSKDLPASMRRQLEIPGAVIILYYRKSDSYHTTTINIKMEPLGVLPVFTLRNVVRDYIESIPYVSSEGVPMQKQISWHEALEIANLLNKKGNLVEAIAVMDDLDKPRINYIAPVFNNHPSES